MSATQVLLVAFVVWIAIGLTAAVVMGRRGHAAFTWLVVGAVLGPLSIPVAIRSVRAGGEVAPRELRAPTPGGGTIDVLVGIDGSDASHAALERSIELIGDRVGRLVLATVLDVETASTGGPERREREAELEGLASGKTGGAAGVVVLAGRPADTLRAYAAEHGFELLVVGRRGRGASKAILGSTASALSERSDVPLLIP
ncbi:MAG: universal stress protein [Actinomycetota bacterium]